MSDRFNRENLLIMEASLLRAVIRERTHHTLEFLIDHMAQGGKAPSSLGEVVKTLLGVWKERGFKMDLPDIEWSQKLLRIAEDLIDGKGWISEEEIHEFSDEELGTVDHLIFGRRSIRTLSEEKVPMELVKKIVDAGLWAPNACNLQTTRVLIIRDEEGLSLFKGGEARGGSVRLIVCQDERPYDFFSHQVPERNRLLDSGAATQNMLLMAHALGLGAVWITFGSKEIEGIRKMYDIPEYYSILTCIALGWPLTVPITPSRMRVEDILLT
jgi:nitroreductase